MLVLCCARKLLGRLRVSPDPVDAASTTVLGDWYATILMMRPAHQERIPDAVADTLSDLGMESQTIERERAEMPPILSGPTRTRARSSARSGQAY